jgi:poly-gamma-glutamate synthesis protein (capsule biosynthesis protein)
VYASRIRTVLVAGLLVVLAACGADGDGGRSERTAAPTRPVERPSTTTSTTVAIPSATSPTTTTVTAPPPVFGWTVAAVEGAVRARVEGSSWRTGCPVPLEDLRYVRVSHWGFDGAPHVGELVVHHEVVDGLQAVFAELFVRRFPIRMMRLVDDFGADDDASVTADNTSAFNCRPVTGGTRWSQHSYGRAIDVNPFENPYVTNGRVLVPGSATYVDRSNVRPGMILAGDAVVDAFAARGWTWGGSWSSPIDYQHFSTSGG